MTRRKSRQPVKEIHPFDRVDVSIENQERLKKQLYEAAANDPRLTGNPRERIENFWKSVIFPNGDFYLPVMFKLLSRYRNDPSKKLEFIKLEFLIKGVYPDSENPEDPKKQDPQIRAFWEKVLKDRGKAPYRLPNQSEDDMDAIHPFDLLAEDYYKHQIQKFEKTVSYYHNARVWAKEQDFKKAVLQVRYSVARYYDNFGKDDFFRELSNEKNILKAISDWKDPEEQQKAFKAFTSFKTIMHEKVLPKMWQVIDEGLEYSAFSCFKAAQSVCDRELKAMKYEGTLFVNTQDLKNESEPLPSILSSGAIVIKQRINSLFLKFHEIFAHPSYLVAARLHHHQARRLADFTKYLMDRCNRLNPEVDSSEYRKLLRHIEINCIHVHDLYRNALTYTTVAVNLEQTGGYKDLPHTDHIAPRIDIFVYQSIEEYSAIISDDAIVIWQFLLDHYMVLTNDDNLLGWGQPASCKTSASKILEKFTPPTESESKNLSAH